MAGSFGFEAGHYDVSMQVGEQHLLPAVRQAGTDTLIIADGFSCHEQIEQGAGRTPLHLAEVIQMALHQGDGHRPHHPGRKEAGRGRMLRTAALVGAGAVLGGLLLRRADQREGVMKAQRIGEAHGEKTFAVIFDSGDEVKAGLLAFAREQRLAGSHFTAIGAFSDVTLGYFDWQKKDYKKIPVREQVEVLSLVGDVSLKENGEPEVHVHVVVGRSDGTTLGGHLMEAHVRPTLEVMVVESPRQLQRRHDPESGLALIRL